MTNVYWVTMAVDALDEIEAIELVDTGRVVEVQPEPPQGSTIVGDMHEDEL